MSGRIKPSPTAAIGAALLTVMLAGCGAHDGLNEPIVPNSPPDTRLSAEPPLAFDGGAMIRISWEGSDPDGEVRGFELRLIAVTAAGAKAKIARDGGVIVVAGAEAGVTGRLSDDDGLGDWWPVTVTDSLFVLRDGPDALLSDERPAVTLQVRAVDDGGLVDPSPAELSFDRRTILPSVAVTRPARLSGYRDAQPVPATVTFGYTGVDPDGQNGMPVQVRYIWKRALVDEPPEVGHYVWTKYEFDQRVEELMSFDDPAWSDWMPYSPNPRHRQVTFPDQPVRDEQGRLITYLFGLQVMDETGAVSLDRNYGVNVHNVYISPQMTPLLTVYEPNLGLLQATGVNTIRQFEIAGGLRLNFSWIGSAERYAGSIASYRYGWDVTDPEDEFDPNWAVPPGLTSRHLSGPQVSFPAGMHTLIVQCRDNSGQLTRATVILDVVPVPAPQAQRPLLLIDDVRDRDSWAWIVPDGTPLDRDPYRDAFWQDVLAGQGGVEGFNPARDVLDAETQTFGYRELVDYRAVVWTTRYAQGNFIWDHFKPVQPGSPGPLVWLRTYQQDVGNLLLAGPRSQNSFIEEREWMLPIYLQDDFGDLELPDGTVAPVGTLRYPWRGMGLAVLDHVVPRYPVWGTVHAGSSARSAACSGVKGLALDPDFKTAHMPGAAAFADTILAESAIDWKDLNPAYPESLRAYIWGSDEFYDGNITDRPDTWTPQECGGMPCVEPMFRIYSRFDWVDDVRAAGGDSDWPAPLFDEEDLEAVCGRYALDAQTGRTRVAGQVLGLVSYKTIANKPSGRGDVLWGFDPYRFDHGEVRKAIQWVLGDQFGLVMRP